eukprot:SAG31_NODE_27092_length_431_cov_1.234940_1_plen_100_part_01
MLVWETRVPKAFQLRPSAAVVNQRVTNSQAPHVGGVGYARTAEGRRFSQLVPAGGEARRVRGRCACKGRGQRPARGERRHWRVVLVGGGWGRLSSKGEIL